MTSKYKSMLFSSRALILNRLLDDKAALADLETALIYDPTNVAARTRKAVIICKDTPLVGMGMLEKVLKDQPEFVEVSFSPF